ncbi:MAG: hypothetical protein INR65_01965 [Gluconacetobacter diazotrophicus]|nr:hypothetical protein [Gluconacetobacter diazotrophicus]
MIDETAQIALGDVVACGEAAYVVHDRSDDDLTLLRIATRDGARHRADVALDLCPDMVPGGSPDSEMVVRCVPLKRYGTANLTRLGVLPARCRERVEIALRRERTVRRFEDSPAVQSNLMASTVSRGRRVGAVRYA